MDLVARIRNVKAEKGIAPGQPVDLLVAPADPEARRVLQDLSQDEIRVLVRLSSLDITQALNPEEGWTAGVSARYKFALKAPQAAVDVEGERKRIASEMKKAAAERDKFAAKLQSPSFAEKAPADVVDRTRRLQAEFARKVVELEAALARLAS